MDDQLKDRLAKYLGALEKGAQRAGEFAEVEIPLAVKEYLWWYGLSHAVYALVFVALAVGFYLIGRRLTGYVLALETGADKKPLPFERWDDDHKSIGAFGYFLRYVVPCLCLIGFVYHGMDTLKVAVSPRVVLIEKAAELVSQPPAAGKK